MKRCIDCSATCDDAALRCRPCQDKHRTRPLSERFWEKVDRRGPDECWPWLGGRNSFGYGCIGTKGRTVRQAPRVAWELTNGPIPPGMHVCHHCDNPPCCNVKAHLFLGTHADNIADAVAKSRFPLGTKHWFAKLTEDDVREIRRRYAAKEMLQQQLADRYGVCTAQISNIVNRRQWKHLP